MSDTVILQRRVIVADPHDCTDSDDALTLLGAVYDTLLRRADEGFAPALATDWTLSDDARVWTLRLRASVRFHDGAPFDAKAAAASLRRMARPDRGVTLGAPGVWAQYLGGAAIEPVDSLTLRIALAAPMADLGDVLAQGFIASPAALDDPVAKPVGTGPYAVAAIDADEVLLRANPACFDGAPSVARLRWRAEASASARLAAVARGEAALATRLAPDAAAPEASVVDHLSPTTLIYLFNTTGVLTDRRIRRALNLALDREALVRGVLGGAGTPLYGCLSPAHVGFVPPARTGPDPDAARALLAQAGVASGLELTVDCPTSLPDEAEALTAAVAAQLAPLGVRLAVRLHSDRTAYAHRVRRSEIGDMCVFDSSPLSTYRVLREKLDSRVRGSWWLGYANPALEGLIDAARLTVDDAARAALYRQCHDALVEDPPWLTCYCHRYGVAMRGDPAGWTPPRDGVLDVRALPAAVARHSG